MTPAVENVHDRHIHRPDLDAKSALSSDQQSLSDSLSGLLQVACHIDYDLDAHGYRTTYTPSRTRRGVERSDAAAARPDAWQGVRSRTECFRGCGLYDPVVVLGRPQGQCPAGPQLKLYDIHDALHEHVGVLILWFLLPRLANYVLEPVEVFERGGAVRTGA